VEGGGVEGQRVDGGDKVPSKDCTRSPDWVRACGIAIMRAFRARQRATSAPRLQSWRQLALAGSGSAERPTHQETQSR